MSSFREPARRAILAVLLLAFAACHSVPPDALKLAPESAHNRQLQTRSFENTGESELLAASAGVVQDLGFTLDESESKLGLIAASRRLTARRPLNGREMAGRLAWTVIVPILGAPYTAYGMVAGVKEPQVVRLSLVTNATATDHSTSVRVTAQRVIYLNERMTKVKSVEPLNDPEFYRQFFDRLSKSAFLERHPDAL